MSDPRAFQQYHGTPITPARHLARLEGFGFCVSYAAPEQIARCHEIGPVMIDNGAFSFWQERLEGRTPSVKARAAGAGDWTGFYAWVGAWLEASPSTWACIPDVIDGDTAANDALIAEWPFGDRGAPVWHLHEPIERLLELAAAFPRVCFGSSGAYRFLQTPAWWGRMRDAWDALLPAGGRPECQLHMLRGMALSDGPFPFASVDSTDIARNHCRYRGDVRMMADRWATKRPPAEYRPQLALL
jgi:hypothetical protein